MQSDSPAVVIINPVEEADGIARIVAMEVAHQIRPLKERIALPERAVRELRDRT
jgi:hypothetical protein